MDNTVARTDDFLNHCGVNYCPSFADNLTVSAGTVEEEMIRKGGETKQIVLMSVILVTCSLLSPAIVYIFLDPPSR